MIEIKVKYSFQHNNERYSFNALTELGEKESEQLSYSFLLWERQLRKFAIIHFINEKLHLDSEKLLDVQICNK